MYYDYDISEDVIKKAETAEQDCREFFERHEQISLYWSSRILKAFQKYNVSSADFIEITGYGYDDAGRDKLEKIYAEVFSCEDALVRVQIMSGTHAIYLALSGLLKHDDTMISLSGAPYDTLCSVIGISGDSRNSLIANGIKYEQIDLIENDFDIPAICDRLKRNDVRLVEIQRSRGYSSRKSLTLAKIEHVIREIRKVNQDVIIMVDNCYGEFTDMMKNPGGGIAVTGGYCAGKKELIQDIAERLTAPMIGKDLGANMNQLMSLYKGLFLAPAAVCSSMKTMIFAARLLQLCGITSIDPMYDEERTDIVQTIDFETEANQVNFCVGMQHASPVDSFVTPVPGDMPGYPHEEIMAAGTFTTGSTIELSADGPVTPPYTVYMQGGLTWEYGKLGIINAVNEFLRHE